MQFKFALVLSFVLPMLCVPLLMIGIAGTTHAGDIFDFTSCVPGGTECPRRDREADCPQPWSDNNYFCSENPNPGTCFGPSLNDCWDLTPASASAAEYPCGREYTCKSGLWVYDSTGTVLINCSQVPSDCVQLF